MFKGERVFPKTKYSVTKKGNMLFLKREHLDNHIPIDKKIVFTGPVFDKYELETIKSVKIAETIANVLALKKKKINVQDEWEIFINGDDGYHSDLAAPYEKRLYTAYEYIKQNVDLIPNSLY